MQIVLCRKCGERMGWQIHAEHVTAACICGMRVAAQYMFFWKQIPALLRLQATKAFGANGKWRIQPRTALEHAIHNQAIHHQAIHDQRNAQREHANARTSAKSSAVVDAAHAHRESTSGWILLDGHYEWIDCLSKAQQENHAAESMAGFHRDAPSHNLQR